MTSERKAKTLLGQSPSPWKIVYFNHFGILNIILATIWDCHRFPTRQHYVYVLKFNINYRKVSPPSRCQTWTISSALRCCEKLRSCSCVRCRMRWRTVGLELLIVSSVLAKSAGCDSRPLSWYLLTTGLGIFSSHLPYHHLHHDHYLSLHSHLNVFEAGMRISASVSTKRWKLTTTDCRLTSVGSRCWLRFVSFW